MDFNETKQTYKSTVDKAIAFSGKDLDFFTSLKANYINDVARSELPLITRPKLLDVGCGHGYIHQELSQMGFDVVGIEIASEVVDIARKANPDISYFCFDGNSIPFDDDTFDIVTAMCVMHHVPPKQWPKFLLEIRRVLRPGGVIMIIEHNPFNPITRYVVANNEIDDDAVLLSSLKLKHLLKHANFSNVITRNILFTPFANRFFRIVDKILWWCPFGAQYYIYGKAE